MARPLKYRFDLIPAGDSQFYEGAKLGDISRRLSGYVSRLAKHTNGTVPVFVPMAVDGGVVVERLLFVTRLPDPVDDLPEPA